MKTITLANLAEATEQEVFDQVARHLLKQNNTSTRADDGETCAYRGIGNTKCATGCLIADDEYIPEMDNAILLHLKYPDIDIESDGTSWQALVKVGLVPSKHEDLIFKMQLIHDGIMIEDWKDELKELAEKFNLNTNALQVQ